MSISNLRCLAIPDDALLKDFDVIGQLDVRFLWDKEENKQDVILLNDIRFVLYKYKVEVLVKKWFKCDGGSIPRVFWSSVGSPYATRLLLAYIFHDAIYASELFERKQCDRMFLEFMKELKENWYNRNKIYSGVDLFGWIVWSKHKKEETERNKELVQAFSFA